MPDGLPDMVPMDDTGLLADHGPGDHRFDQDGVHEVHRHVRRVLDEHPGTMAVGEIWVSDDDRLAMYLRADELQLAFNFKLLLADWDADELRTAIDHSLATVAQTPAPACWVLSNHDRPRHVTRYGGGALGTRRARAAEPAGEASASANQSRRSELWLGTRSTVTRSPSRCASASIASNPARSPKTGSTSRGSATS